MNRMNLPFTLSGRLNCLAVSLPIFAGTTLFQQAFPGRKTKDFGPKFGFRVSGNFNLYSFSDICSNAHLKPSAKKADVMMRPPAPRFTSEKM